MRILGIILIVLGLAGFILGGVSFSKEKKVADLGPLDVKKKETHTVPVTPIAAGAAVLAGIALVIAGSRGGRSA